MNVFVACLLSASLLRLRYALDQAGYQIACEEEASQHYCVPPPRGLSRARLWGRGFRAGLLCRRVPTGFARAVGARR
jgi:hypothetical protein